MKSKTVFFCTECGNETPKWHGRCPACGSWNTLAEQEIRRNNSASKITSLNENKSATPISQIGSEEEIRFDTGLSELDRVLGGGAVKGSVVLVGGAPGIGKSTLLLQICSNLCRFARVLYVTGEESRNQIKMRAERLNVSCDELFILSETNLADIFESVENVSPDILIIDSIQTLSADDISSSAGSVSQVKECTLRLTQLAKSREITVFVIGHINKDGAIAGPKVLEHMVDCVLYFEGENSLSYRILRAAKNRFGSTNEIGVFEMTSGGLTAVSNPSELLLSGRPQDSPGTCVTCVMEGTRPILAEIQALVTKSSFNVPRRNSNGLDYNRAMLLLAVLEKRGSMNISSCDAYINIIGGLTINEPCSDLAAILAIASSFLDKPIPDELAAFGEVGLTGEIRSVSSANLRLSEIRRLGFKKCVLPHQTKSKYIVPEGLEIIQVKNIREALKIFRI